MAEEAIRFDARAPSPEAYLALFETTGWNRMYRVDAEEAQRALATAWHVVSAYRAEELVGVGRLVSDGVLYAVVFDLIVAPSLQGKGIGSALLERLLGRCEEAGIRDVLLFAAAGTEAFYRRHGFVPRPQGAPGMILRRLQEAREA